LRLFLEHLQSVGLGGTWVLKSGTWLWDLRFKLPWDLVGLGVLDVGLMWDLMTLVGLGILNVGLGGT
jgi:hypothetical protein